MYNTKLYYSRSIEKILEQQEELTKEQILDALKEIVSNGK